MNPCGGLTILDPASCRCCLTHRQECTTGSDCCSGDCHRDDNNILRCFGYGPGEVCQSNEQCASEICSNGVCRCRTGEESCGNGECAGPCDSDETRIPGSCRCCLRNGLSCLDPQKFCCAGSDRCTGTPKSCAGKADGEVCTFDAQCIDNHCDDLSGKCGQPGIGQ